MMWRWLIAVSNKLHPWVMSAAAATLRATARLRLGLFSPGNNKNGTFSTHTDESPIGSGSLPTTKRPQPQRAYSASSAQSSQSSSPTSSPSLLQSSLSSLSIGSAVSQSQSQSRPPSADNTGQLSWLQFLDSLMNLQKRNSVSVFAALETLSVHLDNINPDSLVERFYLYKVTLKSLSLSATASDTIALSRRRVVRERVVASVLSWFADSRLWAGGRYPRLAPIEEYLALKEFIVQFAHDSESWQREYSETGQIGHLKSSPNKCGADSATDFIRQKLVTALDGRDEEDDCAREYLGDVFVKFDQATGSAVEPSKTESRSASSNGVDGSHEQNWTGALLLVNVLIHSEMDKLIAWQNDKFYPPEFRSESHRINRSERKKVRAVLEKLTSAATLSQCIKAAWSFSPDLAIQFSYRFPQIQEPLVLQVGDDFSSCAFLLSRLLRENAPTLSLNTQAVHMLANMSGAMDKPSVRWSSLLWDTAEVPVVLGMLSRLSRRYSAETTALATTSALTVAGAAAKPMRSVVPVALFRYVLRSLRAASTPTDNCHSLSYLGFYLPQLVQLLRGDSMGVLRNVLTETCTRSVVLCHQLYWILQVEQGVQTSMDQWFDQLLHHQQRKVIKKIDRYGHCSSLKGSDPLPTLCTTVLASIQNTLSLTSMRYIQQQYSYFTAVISISAKLKNVPDKKQHPNLIKENVDSIKLSPGLYLPVNPTRFLTGVDSTSGAPMQSAAKCPFFLAFYTAPWKGPDSFLASEGGHALLSRTMAQGQSQPPRSALAGHPRLTTEDDQNHSVSIVSASSPSRAATITSATDVEFDGEEVHAVKVVTSSLKKSRGRGKKGGIFTVPKKLRFDLDDPHDEIPHPEFQLFEVSPLLPQDAGGASPLLSPVAGGSSSINVPAAANFSVRKDVESSGVRGSVGGGGSSRALLSSSAPDRPSIRKVEISDRADSLFMPGQDDTEGTEQSAQSSRGPTKKMGASAAIGDSINTNTTMRSSSNSSSNSTADSSARVDACIFKVYDDCRQDALVIQVVRVLQDAFLRAGVPLFLAAYGVVPMRSGDDKALGGIVEVRILSDVYC